MAEAGIAAGKKVVTVCVIPMVGLVPQIVTMETLAIHCWVDPAGFRLGAAAYQEWLDLPPEERLRLGEVEVAPDARLLPDEVVLDLDGQEGGFSLRRLEELACADWDAGDDVSPRIAAGDRPGFAAPS